MGRIRKLLSYQVEKKLKFVFILVMFLLFESRGMSFERFWQWMSGLHRCEWFPISMHLPGHLHHCRSNRPNLWLCSSSQLPIRRRVDLLIENGAMFLHSSSLIPEKFSKILLRSLPWGTQSKIFLLLIYLRALLRKVPSCWTISSLVSCSQIVRGMFFSSMRMVLSLHQNSVSDPSWDYHLCGEWCYI